MAKFQSLKKLNFGKNIKAATKKTEIMSDLWGLLAIITYIVPASLLKLEGYTGMFVSWFLTWITGAGFNIPALRRSSFALVGVHLAYSKLTSNLNDMGVSVWRMGGDDFNPATALTTTTTTTTGGNVQGLRGVYGYNNLPQPQATIQLPSGNVMARPFNQNEVPNTTDTMMGLRDGELLKLPSKGTMEQVIPGSPEENPNLRRLPGGNRKRR